MCAKRSRKEPKSKVRLFSPAKLNLFFRVLSKREDGYHEIASLMQAITLGDTLTIEKARSDILESDDPSLPCDDTNLVHKGLTLFREKTGVSFPVKILVEKRIPMEGGLGGGSSNLATTLWGLNVLAGNLATLEELREWAGVFSSDAPFFFSSGTAYCTGRGEKIASLAPLPDESLWLAQPAIGMSTPLVYRHCTPHACSAADPLQLLKGRTWVNDLEAPSFTLNKALKKLKQDLLSLGFREVVMTGSGSTFFCLGEVESPKLPNVQFIRSKFHSREENEWYNTPKYATMRTNEYAAL